MTKKFSRLARVFAGFALAVTAQAAASAGTNTLAVLDFDLIEEHHDPTQAADMQRRIVRMESMFREGMLARNFYEIKEIDAARVQLKTLREQQEHMHRCSACQIQIGKAVGARLVATGWVQKVSNLILNINIEIRDVEADRVVLNKSVDIRGNNDRAWEHGMKFMLRDFAERRAHDSGYGL